MRKALILLSCILAIYGVIGAQSGAITDCKKVTLCKTYTGNNGNCAVEWEYERCSGGFTGVYTACFTCEEGTCSCNCQTTEGSIYSMSYVDCQGVVKFETKSCLACATPTPTPTPTPECVATMVSEGGTSTGYCDVLVQSCEDWADNDCDGPRDYQDEGCQCMSPVAIDVLGNGFDFTSFAGGVNFDMRGNGRPMRLAWIQGDDAWLALDRDGNGTIDNGLELFGNVTDQPRQPLGVFRNGFLALSVFDQPANGGNGDGVISASDAVFSQLRLWQDTNHNGFSEPGELHTLPEFSIATLELDYKESKQVDRHGNQYRFRAKVKDAKGAQVNRWAWDVFLVTQ